jgi:hypothetical protein
VFVLTGVTAGPIALLYPAVSAIKSTLSDDNEQGKVQGAIAAVKDLCGAFGPLVFGALFKLTSSIATTEVYVDADGMSNGASAGAGAAAGGAGAGAGAGASNGSVNTTTAATTVTHPYFEVVVVPYAVGALLLVLLLPVVLILRVGGGRDGQRDSAKMNDNSF